MHQELIEILYHTLWETVHVFFEHRELGHDVGEAGFLYPFLGREKQATADLVDEVAVVDPDEGRRRRALRAQVAREQADAIGEATLAIHERLAPRRQARSSSATAARRPTPTTGRSTACARRRATGRCRRSRSRWSRPTSRAIANDVGTDVVFLRQLIAHARPETWRSAISTSGGSRNVIVALEEARKRGLLTVALLGYDGGEIRRRGLADHCIVVGSDYIPRIQEVQASIYHVMRESLEGLRHGSARAVRHGHAAPTPARCASGWSARRRLRRIRRRGRRAPRARACARWPAPQRTVPVLVEDGAVVQVGWQGRGCTVSA